MIDCYYRISATACDCDICTKHHQEILPGFCDDCPEYFPKAPPESPLTRAYNSMTREEQQQCLLKMYTTNTTATF